MRKIALLAGLGAILTGSSLLAVPGLGNEEGGARWIAGVKDMSLRPATAAERRRAMALWMSLRSGDGGGGTLADLAVWQTSYVESECPEDCEGIPCNAVILVWDEDLPAEAAVEVAVDDQVVGEVAAGQQVFYLAGIGAGSHTFRVRSGSDEASSESTLTVLDGQPFGDPLDVVCSEGAMDGDGTCVTEVAFEHPAVRPEYYAVYFDDEFLGTLPADIEPPEFSIPGVSPGEHGLLMLAVIAGDGYGYQGCPVFNSCLITCHPEGCQSPLDFHICQLTYGDGPREVLAAWFPPAPGYTGVRAFIDGNFAGDHPGETRLLRFEIATPQARVGIQGTCANGDTSVVAEGVLPLLEQTPHTNPVTGPPTCRYEPDSGIALLSWENADPSDLLIIHVETPTGSHIRGLFDGHMTSLFIPGTGPEDVFHLQFLVLQGDGCYGSDLVTCIPTVIPKNRAPICNGSAVLDISSPIHLLGALFTQGTSLSCPAACECNGDETVDVADAICMLGFLFQGSRAPVTWYPGCRSMVVPFPCPGPSCDA